MPYFAKKLPPMNTLVAFEAAARLGSFSRAADEIGRTQASVSRQIKLLEENIGLSLFERQRHNVVLTTLGAELALVVQQILSELATTSERIREQAKGNESLIVFTDISIATVLVSPMLGEFQRMFPDLKVKILSSDETIAQTTEHFDIGVQLGDRAKERFHTFPIADDAVFPVCSPGFAAKYSSLVKAEDLASMPLLHMDDKERGWTDWPEFLEHIGSEQRGDARGLTFTTYDVCLEVAARGEGVALGWARSVKPKIEEGKLVRLSDFVLPLPNSIYAYLPRLGQKSKKVEVFLDILNSKLEAIDFM